MNYVMIARTFQALPHSIEYKEDLKRAAKRTVGYAARALEVSDVVINESIYGANGFAIWQVNAVREA